VAECIHNGGTGAIFRVDPPDGADPGFPLVMKVPRIGRGESTLGIESFEVEQMILPALRGPHVPRVVSTGDVATTPYIVMERIEGLSLAKIVARRATARGSRADRRGARRCHPERACAGRRAPRPQAGERDAAASGEALLLDFGFSRHAHYPDLLGEEQHFAAGSAAYVSRSSCRTIAAIRAAISMRSACCSTSSRPASRRSANRRRSPACATGCGASRFRRECCARRPPWLQEVILHCLENDPAVRYQSAAHVALDLRNPDQVVLSARASALEAPRFLSQLGRWWRARRNADRRWLDEPRALPRAVVILVAVDTEHPTTSGTRRCSGRRGRSSR
jgi:serine/threonine protein kinase